MLQCTPPSDVMKVNITFLQTAQQIIKNMNITENRVENVFEAEQSAIINYQQPILFCDYCFLKALRPLRNKNVDARRNK